MKRVPIVIIAIVAMMACTACGHSRNDTAETAVVAVEENGETSVVAKEDDATTIAEEKDALAAARNWRSKYAETFTDDYFDRFEVAALLDGGIDIMAVDFGKAMGELELVAYSFYDEADDILSIIVAPDREDKLGPLTFGFRMFLEEAPPQDSNVSGISKCRARCREFAFLMPAIDENPMYWLDSKCNEPSYDRSSERLFIIGDSAFTITKDTAIAFVEVIQKFVFCTDVDTLMLITDTL